MKFYFVSDIYAEGASKSHPIIRKPDKDVDAILVAGNIQSGEGLGVFLLEMFEDFPETPIVYVAGDHEHFRSGMPVCELVEKLKKESEIIRNALGKYFFYLENDSAILSINGEMVKFIGATLWSDYGFAHGKFDAISQYAKTNIDIFQACLGMGDLNYPHSMTNDFTNPRPLMPEDVVLFNKLSRHYLETELKRGFNGKVVVITNYPPLKRSLNKEPINDDVKQFYYSDCENIILQNHIDLWVHGHTTSSLEYKIHSTIIASNPHGNPKSVNPDYLQDRLIVI